MQAAERARITSVRVTRLELPLLDPQLRRHLGIVMEDLLDEALGVLAPDEHLERVSEREVGRESVVDHGIDDHEPTMTRSRAARKMAVRDVSVATAAAGCRAGLALQLNHTVGS
jgi:hypothetical protein